MHEDIALRKKRIAEDNTEAGKGKGSSHQETEREGGLGKRIESECREGLGVGERDNQQE